MARLARDPADWLPVLVITIGVALACVPLVVALPVPALVALWLVSVAARSIAPVHQHCHAHYRVFSRPVANAAYDAVLMLAAGNITAVWELQHVHGHHQSYLTPALDPAACERFGTSRVVFTLLGDALSFTDSLAVARRRGRPIASPGIAGARGNATRCGVSIARLWRQQLVQLAVLAALVVANPAIAIAFFVVPALALRWAVFWFSYAQHHATPLTDVYSGSVTHFGWTNRLFLNVGHHTAHHEKPTLHWSRLPARTAQILERIPAACLR